MKEKFLIFIALFVLIAILVGLNAASFVQKESVPDKEIRPNRSTYNVGSTGTRAFYDLLYETDRKVTRWQQPISELLKYESGAPSTFVVVGKTQRPFEQSEIDDLQKWVAYGGKLIFVGREMVETAEGEPIDFLNTLKSWQLSISAEKQPDFLTDPANQKLMTESVSAAKPSQPTLFTKGINAVQPSRFAAFVELKMLLESSAETPNPETGTIRTIEGTAENPQVGDNDFEEFSDEPPPQIGLRDGAEPLEEKSEGLGFGSSNSNKNIVSKPTPAEEKPLVSPPQKTTQIAAPIIHLASEGNSLLVEFPYGEGRVVYLTDPYIISNGGIELVDNAQLGINLLTSHGGIVAFDEFHQGYGANNNLILAYFEGTPVVAFFLQFFVLIGLVFYAQSRRFARALPDDEPNRLSKLEYVAAMAQLQQRTKAYDLAVENIYKDFRRRASRLVGVDNFTISLAELAKLVAERVGMSFEEIQNLMQKCEDIMHGEQTNKKEVISLIGSLRTLEIALGLRRGR